MRRNTPYDYNEIKEYINSKETGGGCKLVTTQKEFNERKIKQSTNPSKVILKILCGKCQEDYLNTSLNAFKKGKKQCRKCSYKTSSQLQPKTQAQFEKDVYSLVGDEYTVLAQYKNSVTPIKMKHNICQHEFFPTGGSFLSGVRCPKCQHRSYKKTDEEFKQDVFDIVGDEYEVLGKYIRCGDKILFRHNCEKCNYSEWKSTPTNFLNGNRCPICNESKGERAVREYLCLCNINHNIQYSFGDLISDLGYPLRFDFAIFNKNNELSFLIEYDGEFHYKQIYPEHDFVGQQKRDKIKDEYCKLHNIDLLRIPYWDFDNIETILNEKLSIYK